MGKYQVYNNGIITEFDSLFDAYSSVDYDGVFLTLKDYIDSEMLNMTTCTEFIQFASKVDQFSMLLATSIRARYNINDLTKIYVLITGSNDYADTRHILLLDHSYFIPSLNLHLANLGYIASISKNDDYIEKTVRDYLSSHKDILIKTVECLHLNYSLHFIVWLRTELFKDSSIEKDFYFNVKHPYAAVINNKLYSSVEHKVLIEFLNNLDEIVDIISFNKEKLISKKALPNELLKIMAY